MVNDSKAFVKKEALATYDQTQQIHMHKRGCPVTPDRRRPSLYAVRYIEHTLPITNLKKEKKN